MATYTFTTDGPDEAAITDARQRYNNGLPLKGIDPDAKGSNDAYMQKVFDDAVASWGLQAVHASLNVTEKASAAVILQAAVDRNDEHSEAAAVLLARLANAT